MSHVLATAGNLTITSNASITRLPEDEETDGLPNSWWSQYGITGTDRVSSADPDNDGFTNAQENALGTDPTSAASRFAANSPERTGDSITISWSSVSGKTYQLQSKSNLTDQWADVGDPVPAAIEGATTSQTLPASGTKHFYRVRLVVP